MAVCDAIQCVDAAIPNVPASSGLVVNTGLRLGCQKIAHQNRTNQRKKIHEIDATRAENPR